MPRKLCLDDLIQAKEKHQFLWTWREGKFPPKRTYTEKNSRTQLHLQCGVCKQWHWVEWSTLRRGASRCCWDCVRFPTLEKMQEIVATYNMFWKPSLIFKSDPKTKRRVFLFECKCGKKQWVRWNHFQQGLTRGCKSCTSAQLKHGLSKDPLFRTWRSFKGYVDKIWLKFENFKKWATPLYSPGWKLIRINVAMPYGPDNCDYVPINKRDLGKEINLSPGPLELPTGLRKAN